MTELELIRSILKTLEGQPVTLLKGNLIICLTAASAGKSEEIHPFLHAFMQKEMPGKFPPARYGDQHLSE